MREDLIDKLSKLNMSEKMIKRCLDIKCYDEESRRKCFVELQQIQKEIQKIKFKLRMEKEIKNDKNNNTN